MKKNMIEPKDRVKDFICTQMPNGYFGNFLRYGGIGRIIGDQDRMLFKVNGQLILELVTYPGTRIERKIFLLKDNLGRPFEEAALEAFTLFIQHGLDPIMEDEAKAV